MQERDNTRIDLLIPGRTAEKVKDALLRVEYLPGDYSGERTRRNFLDMQGLYGTLALYRKTITEILEIPYLSSSIRPLVQSLESILNEYVQKGMIVREGEVSVTSTGLSQYKTERMRTEVEFGFHQLEIYSLTDAGYEHIAHTIDIETWKEIYNTIEEGGVYSERIANLLWRISMRFRNPQDQILELKGKTIYGMSSGRSLHNKYPIYPPLQE